MKKRTLLCGTVFGAGMVLVAASVLSAAGAGDGGQDVQKALAEASKLGDSHKAIQHIRGSYTHTIKWWASPEAQPIESEAIGETEWILEGRFATQRIKGQWMDIRFESFAAFGYDSTAGAYKGFWMDTLGNRMLSTTGQLGESGEAITMQGEYVDVITHEPVKVRSVFVPPTRQRGAKLEMFRPDSGGQEFKFLEIATERRVPRAG